MPLNPTPDGAVEPIYALSEHDRPDLESPLLATDWFWSHGDHWNAVYAPFHPDWWEGADPEDIAARPDPWRYPIDLVPPGGTLVWSDAAGNVRSSPPTTERVRDSDARRGSGDKQYVVSAAPMFQDGSIGEHEECLVDELTDGRVSQFLSRVAQQIGTMDTDTGTMCDAIDVTISRPVTYTTKEDQ